MSTLFDAYRPSATRYDELIGPNGQPRAHWRALVDSLSDMEAPALLQRQRELRRLLIEHGVSYNVYGKTAEKPRAWALDLLPLPISSRQWRDVEVGVAQRAELLRQMLHDLYGQQQLIRRGLIPPELIYGHRGYLLPCFDVERSADRALQIYAADLGRAPDGSFWVTGDRTQAPSGIGYALEARTVTSRVLPSMFRDANVHPILPFVRALRRCLVNLADGDPAQIALLSAGPANETYSEHAFLAHQFGIPLVEGHELEVNRGRVYLSRGGQRQSLRVLLRRMDDDYCDPLELNRSSLLGCPGLLQAARNRQLAFANPLGASVVENPALMAFLPRICRELLGEDLKLPSVPTWWCGDPTQRAEVRADFEQMVVRTIQPGRLTATQAVRKLDKAEQQALWQRIEAEPGLFVAQRIGAQPSAPVLDGRQVHARAVEIRTFAVASNGGFTVMSGGLARAGRSREAWRVSGQLGGVSKDVWVLASEPQPSTQTVPLMLPRFTPFDPRVPAVGAQNLIWFGRYASRAELLARLLRETLLRIGEFGVGGHPLPARLCQALTWQSTSYPGFIGPVGEANLASPEGELLRLCTHTADPTTLAGVLNALRAAADPLRELLSAEQWSQLNLLLYDIHEPATLVDAHRQVSQAHLRLTALNGLLLRTLPAGATRSFIEFGFRLERTDGCARLMRSLLPDEACGESRLSALANLLDVSDQGEWPATNLPALLGTILAQEPNPQSLSFQLHSLDRITQSLPPPRRRYGSRRKLGLDPELMAQIAALDGAQLQHLAEHCETGGPLEALLIQVYTALRALATQIEAGYVERRPSMHQLRSA